MSNYSSLKATINANIKTNGNQEITGSVLNSVLNSMVNTIGAGFQYIGLATPSTNPGTPDYNCFYLASIPGEYTNFGGITLSDGEIAILKYNGTWVKDVTGAASRSAVDELQQQVVMSDTITLPLDSTRNLRPSGSQAKIVSSSDYVFIAPVIQGQDITITTRFSSGYARIGYTQQYPALNVPCVGYESWGTSYTINHKTAPITGYLIITFESNPSEISCVVDAGDTIGHAVADLQTQTSALSQSVSGITTTLIDSMSEVDPVAEGAGWVNKSNGVLNTSVPYGYLYKKIKYDSNVQYYLKYAVISGEAAAVLNYYNENDEFLGYDYNPNTSTEYRNVLITPPAGTKTIIVVSENTAPVIVSSYQKKSYWDGKTILWLGTSIPATPYQNGMAYPQIVGDRIGANILNKAISGSFVRKKFDPNNLGEMSNLDIQWDMLSMVTSFDDIDSIVSNWATYKQCFADAPDTLSQAIINMWKGASYETILDPFMSDADLICFDHGRNDIPNMINQDNMFDLFTFVGGMNWLIQRIYENNPRARICIISHYESQTFPEIVEAQEYVSNYWSIPLFRLDKMLGWSNKQITTKHVWNGNYYVESETDHNTTIQHAWLKDDLHPYLDSSGQATKLIASAIEGWIKNIV